MTPAGTSNELDVQNEWEENTHTHTPLLGRGVFTAGFAPPRPFPTPTYKCVGGSRSRESRLVARRRLASSSSLCQEVMNFSAPCNTPLCHGAPSSIFAARVHTAVNSECEPVVHRRAVCGSELLEVVLETIYPILLRASLAWIFPPDEFSVVALFRSIMNHCRFIFAV